MANRVQWRIGVQWGTVQETAPVAPNQVDLPTAGVGGNPVVRVGVFAMAGGEPSSCDPGPCWSMEWPEPPRTVVLQARANASSPWYVVGSPDDRPDDELPGRSLGRLEVDLEAVLDGHARIGVLAGEADRAREALFC